MVDGHWHVLKSLGDNVLRIKSISYEKKSFIGDFCSK